MLRRNASKCSLISLFFSAFRGVQCYHVVRFKGPVVPQQEYDIVPLPWMLSNDAVQFPTYERTKLEEKVYELQPAQPRKDFKKYGVTIIHSTGKVWK